jgi:hypothetical protein
MLRWVTRCAAVLGVVAVGLSALWPTPGSTLGVALGAALAVGNLFALQWLGARLVARGDARGMASTAALFGVKLLAYLGLVFLVHRLFAVDILALLAGLSVIVLAIPLGAVLGPPLNAENSESIHG